ncbi:MAG: acyltransferase [Mobilicoccus sp.]|nr:acyltransferase [Mobilicoccus sp.]
MRPSLSSDTTTSEVSIQSLRAVAVLLMVAGHVIGDTPERGLQAGEGTALREMYLFLEDVRMPFFTVLSGYVYAIRPVTAGGARRFVTGKVRRLLVPMIVVGVAFMAVQSIVPATNQTPGPGDVLALFFVGYEHLWFLQAIFLVFLAVMVLDLAGVMDRPRGWAIVVGLVAALHVASHVPAPWAVFSINQAMHLLPFFLIGLGLRRFAGRIPAGAWPVALAGTLLIALLVVRELARVEDITLHGPPARAFSLAVGVSGVLLLFGVRRLLHARPLAWLGGFAFGIYLLHVFGAAGARIVLGRLGVEDVPVLFLVGLVAGVAFPVLVQLTLGRHPLVSQAVFGQRRRRTTTPAAPASEERPRAVDLRTGDARRRRGRAARRSRV